MEIPHKNRIFVMRISPTSVYTANKSTGQLTQRALITFLWSLGAWRETGREREGGGRTEGREGERGRKGWRDGSKEEKEEGRQTDGGRERGRGREREGGKTYNIQLYNHVHVHT